MAFGLFCLDRRLSLLDRKSEPEQGAATGAFFNPNPSAMSFDDPRQMVKTKPHSPLTGRTGPIELIEDALFIAGWNPRPSIGDLKNQFVDQRPVADSSMAVEGGQNFRAFSSRLIKTCSINTPSTSTSGRSGGKLVLT